METPVDENIKSPLTLLTLDMSAPAHSNQYHYLQTCTCIQLQLSLEMSESSRHMLTCTTNANSHPGLVDAAQKWSQEDGKTKKEVQEEKKQAKAENKMEAVHTLTAVEKHVAEEYAIDITPKLWGANNKACQLCHTKGYLELPLREDPISDSDDTTGNITGGGWRDRRDEEDPLVTTEEEAPPKKKSKPGFQDAVKTYLDRQGAQGQSRDVHKVTYDGADDIRTDNGDASNNDLDEELLASQQNLVINNNNDLRSIFTSRIPQRNTLQISSGRRRKHRILLMTLMVMMTIIK